MNEPLITRELLDEFGITLNGQDEASFLAHLNETLDQRIGTEVTDSLDDDKLQALVNLQETGTDEQVSAWIQENVPELKEIVADERDILLGEIAENADGINDAA